VPAASITTPEGGSTDPAQKLGVTSRTTGSDERTGSCSGSGWKAIGRWWKWLGRRHGRDTSAGPGYGWLATYPLPTARVVQSIRRQPRPCARTSRKTELATYGSWESGGSNPPTPTRQLPRLDPEGGVRRGAPGPGDRLPAGGSRPRGAGRRTPTRLGRHPTFSPVLTTPHSHAERGREGSRAGVRGQTRRVPFRGSNRARTV